jgi:hypothetical protein
LQATLKQVSQWKVAAVKEKHAMRAPTTKELNEWQHHVRLVDELRDLQDTINKLRAVAMQQNSAGHVQDKAQDMPVAQYRVQHRRQGEQVQHGGSWISVDHLLSTCNRLIRAQDRNLRGRFRTMGSLRTNLVKSMHCRDNRSDIAVGSNVLTVFHGDAADTGERFVFYVGQVRQISAKATEAKKLQYWMSAQGIMCAMATHPDTVCCVSTYWEDLHAHDGKHARDIACKQLNMMG